jgi:hypothetical protein
MSVWTSGPVVPDDKACAERDMDDWLCTEPKNHELPHVARTSVDEICAVWGGQLTSICAHCPIEAEPRIVWVQGPDEDDGWWAHLVHPFDGHDAEPAHVIPEAYEPGDEEKRA